MNTERTLEERNAGILMAKRKKARIYYDSEIPKRMGYLNSILAELAADDSMPWLLTHSTMHEYLADLCGMTLRRIQQITAGEEVKAEVKQLMPDAAQRLDTMKERAVRELVTTPPERRLEVVDEIVRTPGKLTAAKVQKAKVKVLAPVDAEYEPAPDPPVALDPPDNVARMQAAVCRVINAMVHHLPDCWREYLITECDLEQPVDGPYPQARPKQRNPVPATL